MSNDHVAAKVFQGRDVYDAAGEKIGRIEEVYVDPHTDLPTWAMVHTGMLGAKRTFVPLSTSSVEGGDLRVPWLRRQVQSVPAVHAGEALTHADERVLLLHYGLPVAAPSAAVAHRRQDAQPLAVGDVRDTVYSPLDGQPVHAEAHRALRRGDLDASMSTKGYREMDDDLAGEPLEAAGGSQDPPAVAEPPPGVPERLD